MKQHITPEQLAELSDKGKKALFDWELKINTREANSIGALFVQWREDKNLPLLSIGQMIEFLGDNYIGALYNHSGNAILLKVKPENICDTLWEAVKHELSGVGE